MWHTFRMGDSNGKKVTRAATIRVRFTPAERKSIEEAAAKRGQKLSQYCRAVLKRAAAR